MQKIFDELSKELNVPSKVIEQIYRNYWLFIKESVSSIKFERDLKEEGFYKLRAAVSLPNLGKLACTYEKYLKIERKKEYSRKHFPNNEYKKNKTDG